MANVFKNATASGIGTTATTVYTTPAATSTVVIGFVVSNTTASQVKVDVSLGGTTIATGLPLAAGGGYEFVEGKYVLEATDTLEVTSDAAGSIDVFVSVLEQT